MKSGRVRRWACWGGSARGLGSGGLGSESEQLPSRRAWQQSLDVSDPQLLSLRGMKQANTRQEPCMHVLGVHGLFSKCGSPLRERDRKEQHHRLQ